MSPTIRRLSLIAAALAGLLLLLVLALPYVVSLDALRTRVVAAAEEALHRKVEIGAMRIQILSGPGAGVEKFVVHNTAGFESPALVSAERVSVKVAFWPLLSRRIEVRAVVLDGVTVTIERRPDGAMNIDDFLSAGKRDSAPASRTAAAALLVSRIEIARGRALFVDRKVAPGKTITLALDDITGRLTDIGPTTPARFDLAARFLADSGRNLTLRGKLGPPPSEGPVGGAPLEAGFSAKSLALARLGPYVAAFQSTDPGTLTVDGKAIGKMLGALEIAGSVVLAPAGPSSPIPAVDGTFESTLDWPRGALAIGRSVFEVAKLPLAIQGRLYDLHKEPRVDLRIATPGEVELDEVTGLPGLAGRLPASVKLAGRVRVEVQIDGLSSDLEMRGSADASAFGVSMDGQPLFAAPSLHATLGSRGKAPLAGRVTAPSGKLKNLPFEKLVADWTWNQGALTLSPSAGVFGGTLAARVDSDFAHSRSDSHLALDVQSVQGQPLLESVTSLRNVFSGTLRGKMSLTSQGLGWDAVSKTARGEGHIAVADADIRTVQLMPEVARTLAAVGKVAGFQVPASLEDTKFSTLETSLKLADGRLATPDLSMSGRDVSVSADGSIGLDRTLAYQGRIVLGPSIVKSLGNTGRYLADSTGRIALAFRANGPITGPKVTIDESVVLDLGRRVLARAAQDRIGGTAGKMLGDVLDSGDGKKTDPVDILQQLLRPPPPTPTPAPHE
jgi:AsmA protein